MAGLGLLAARDVAAFLRTPSATNPSGNGFRALILYGISQTGRMQRHFLSLGLNRCEDGSRAYDGFHVHIAGARRGAFNHRFAQPSNQTTPLWGHVFPFADVVTSDPLTGRTGGLLERLAAAGDLPKIISTDSAAEYWRGDAALAHIDTAGRHDLPEHPLTRRYLFAGAQHTPGYLGQSRTNPGTGTIARYPLNVLDYLPLHRAALDQSRSLDYRGHRSAAEPASPSFRCYGGRARRRCSPRSHACPVSRRPTRSACPSSGRWIWVATRPRASAAIRRRRARSIRPSSPQWMPTATRRRASACRTSPCRSARMPAGTHAIPVTGSPEQIVPMNGLTLWFAPDEATRAARGDPRRSLAERYRDEADYGAKVRAAALQLAAERYLLEEDVEQRRRGGRRALSGCALSVAPAKTRPWR